jgi:glycosyltransferase involved in cell wall biosynthesis
MAHLYRRADAYVSLHHAEGFGITMAEAMTAGTPVVATGHSGNLEFMDQDSAFLVESKQVAVGKSMPQFPKFEADMMWAQPSLNSAGAALRACVDRPALAPKKAARARARVRAELSPERIGRLMAERIAHYAPA